MKVKKILLLIVFLFIFLLTFNTNVNADIGPKASLEVKIVGVEGEYVAAFASKSTDGPNFDYQDWLTYHNAVKYNKIMEYHDSEGYKWITKYISCNGDTTIDFSYYRPEEFKVIIYKNDELYKVTEVIKCYAFESTFEIDFANIDIKVKNTYNYFSNILGLILRTALTLLIELSLFFILRLYTKRNFLVVLITNIITQLGLNILLNTVIYLDGKLGALFLLIVLEIAITIIEPIIYLILTRKKNKLIFLLYGIIANMISFGLGILFFKGL